MKSSRPTGSLHAGVATLFAFATFATFTTFAAEPSAGRVDEAMTDRAIRSLTMTTRAHDGIVVQRSVAVHYLRSSVNTEWGAQRLYGRLKSAARRACGTVSGRELAAIRDFERCRADALSKAIADVGSRTLTALHRARTPRLSLAGFDHKAAAR